MAHTADDTARPAATSPDIAVADAAPDHPGAETAALPMTTPAAVGRIDTGVTATIQKLVRDDYRARLPTTHPDVAERLDLSREEVDHLFDVLARQFTEQMLASASGDESGRVQNLARLLEANHAELVTLLGSKYGKWKAYSAELPARWELKELGTLLEQAGMPLGSAQTSSLLPMLTVAHELNRQQRIARTGEVDSAADRRILEAAAPFMTPEQLVVYRQMLERQGAREQPPLNAVQKAQRQLFEEWAAR